MVSHRTGNSTRWLREINIQHLCRVEHRYKKYQVHVCGSQHASAKQTKTCAERHGRLLSRVDRENLNTHTHTHNVHDSGLRWGLGGQSTAWLCVCVHPVVTRQATHAESPPVTTSSSPPLLLTRHSVPSLFHRALFLCSCSFLASASSFSSSSDPHPTWSAS